MHSRLLLTAILAALWPAAASAQPATPTAPAATPPRLPASSGIAVSPFDPAAYVTIYEEDGPNHRRPLFTPGSTQSTLLRVDADSKIVIELTGLREDMPLNGVFMTAELSRLAADAGQANVEVLNYSEVAKDPRTQASQAGVALRTASDVKTVLLNLYNVTKDAIEASYQAECAGPPSAGRRPAGCSYQKLPNADQQLRVVLRASQPRVAAITGFFTSDRNGLVLNAIGTRIFELDHPSVSAMAGKFRDDVTKFIAGGAAATEVAPDLYFNLERLWDDMQPLRVKLAADPSYFETEWKAVVFPRFKDALSPGVIDLRKYKAADGETLRLVVQSRAAGGDGTGGVSRDFHVSVKKLKTRITTEPSAFYVRRHGEIRNDKGEIVSQKFSPAPGVTFGPVFYGRHPLLRVFAPGIGANVSFMNFGTGDYDPTIKDAAGAVVGGFKAASGGSLQVGLGVSGSLFSNALQVTVGKNLQVDGARPWYVGIGVGFVQIGQELAKLAKKYWQRIGGGTLTREPASLHPGIELKRRLFRTEIRRGC